jgi:hypothetical protein
VSDSTYHYITATVLRMRLLDFLISRTSSLPNSNEQNPSHVTVPNALDFSAIRMLMTVLFGRQIGRKLIESGHTGTIVMLFVLLERIGPLDDSE